MVLYNAPRFPLLEISGVAVRGWHHRHLDHPRRVGHWYGGLLGVIFLSFNLNHTLVNRSA